MGFRQRQGAAFDDPKAGGRCRSKLAAHRRQRVRVYRCTPVRASARAESACRQAMCLGDDSDEVNSHSANEPDPTPTWHRQRHDGNLSPEPGLKVDCCGVSDLVTTRGHVAGGGARACARACARARARA
jgi:hypothetical protein